MSGPPPDTAFQQLKSEYRRGHIGPLIYGELKRAFAGEGDLGTRDDLVQSFVVGLLKTRVQAGTTVPDAQDALDLVMLRSHTLDQFRKIIRGEVRRFMGRQRSRTVTANLLRRSDKAVLKPPFKVVSSQPRAPRRFAAFCFVDCTCEVRQVDPREDLAARQHARWMPVERVSVGTARPQKLPRLIAPDALPLVLLAVRNALATPVTRETLERVFDDMLAPWRAAEMSSLETAQQAKASELSPPDQLEVNAAADTLASAISANDLVLLDAMFEGRPDADTAETLGVSRQTVIARRTKLFGRLRRAMTESDCRPDLRGQALRHAFDLVTSAQPGAVT